jgi:protein-S-isoprenylcysteine O-methyltransferase Ste14
MQQVRTVGTTEPNNLSSSSSYVFDPESSPMTSKDGPRNQSNTVLIGTSTRGIASSEMSTTRRVLGRMRRLLTSRLLPASALAGLVFWQLGALVAELQEFNLHPGWIVLGECLRSVLYALFLCFPIAAFLTHEPARSRDGSRLVTCAAVAATFLLAGLGLLVPSGMQLWRTSSVVVGIALVITLVGVALAAVSANSLGGSFSFGPQGRALVVRGPYRLVRHPIYLAELAMIVGVTVVNPRLVPLVGAFAVIVLQLVRIRAEERLLRSTFPGFSCYAAATRYRLIPFLW